MNTDIGELVAESEVLAEVEALVEAPRGTADRLFSAASFLAAGNVASRLLGLVREQVVAAFYGTSVAASAFVAASRVPTMLYDLLVGGQLSAALVPVLSGYAATDRRELARAASALLTAAAAITGLASVIVWLMAGPIAGVLGGGLGVDGTLLVERCLRVIAVSVLFFGLAGMATGALYATERFRVAAAAGAVYNAAFILTALAFHERLGLYALPLGVVMGGVVQVVVTFWGLRDVGIRLGVVIRHPALRQVALLYAPVAVGLVVTQFQVVAAIHFMTRAGESVAAAMNFADRLTQFPQGFIAGAISLSILPALAAAHAKDEQGTYSRTLSRGLRTALTLMIPASFGLAVLGSPLVGAIFQRHAFTDESRLAVSAALAGYAVGLPFAGIDLSLNNAFYARKNTLVPAVVGVLSVVIYIGVAAIFGPTWNVLHLSTGGLLVALALAESAKQASHALVMLVLVEREAGTAAVEGLVRTFLAATAAAFVMAAAVWWTDHRLASLIGDHTLAWILRAAVGGGLGLAVYLPLAAFLGVAEVRWLTQLATDRLRRGPLKTA